MAVKVVKFGGSSLADADHFRSVANIIKADPQRKYVVPSAPGKRFSDDIKVTDLFYQCYELIRSKAPKTEIDSAYQKIIELIRERWHTDAEATTSENGVANFRGFFGKYEIEITANGKVWTEEIDLSKKSENLFTIAEK